MKYLVKINPLFKLILSGLIFIFSIGNNKIQPLLIYLLLLILLMILDGLWDNIKSMLIPLSIIFIVITGLSTLFGSEFKYSLILGIRIIYMYLGYTIFNATTLPSDFVRALDKINVPKDISIGLMITIRFIPILKEDMLKIRDAFSIRMKNEKKNINIIYRATIIPILFRMINISDDLSLAVMMRGYGCGTYTPYREVSIKFSDYVFITINLLVMVGLLWIF